MSEQDHFGTAEFIAETRTAGERKYRGGGEGVLRAKRAVWISQNKHWATRQRVGITYDTAAAKFSTVWKSFWRIFHTMENIWPIFPRNGKTFRQFSTQWKECFHGVENLVLGLFSMVFGLFSGAVERSTRRPLSIVERDRPKRPRKRRPPQAVSALSRARLGCGVDAMGVPKKAVA